MTEGISEIDFEQNFGQKLENIYGSVLQKYKETGFGEDWCELEIYKKRNSCEQSYPGRVSVG